MHKQLTPDSILQLGFGFWASKALLSAVEIGLFSQLARGPQSAEDLGRSLDLHPRSRRDFLDALVALKMLERNDQGLYSNTPETDLFLDRAKSTYIGGILEMGNARLWPYWGRLTEALRTGQHQNEAKDRQDLFGELYRTPERLEAFLRAMTGITLGRAQALARKFPWHKYNTFMDVGAAEGALPVHVARAHPHLRVTGYDLPAVGPIFDKYVRHHGVQDRVRFHPGDFFKESLPHADVISMGMILHDWDLPQKKMLIRKVHEALPPGGSFVVIESLIDDARRESIFGLLMSLNMLIGTPGGFDYTGADCQGWLRDAGFRETRVESLAGPSAMVVGVK